MFIIKKLDESFMNIRSDTPDELTHMQNEFTFLAEGFRFSPMFKSGLWDGKIRLLHANGNMPVGLIKRVVDFCRINQYKFAFKNLDAFRLDNHLGLLPEFIESNGLPFDLMPHQLSGLEYIAKNNRGLVISSTGSGKTAIQYIITKFWLDVIRLEKIAIVVPNKSLVNQMFQHFIKYTNSEYVHENFTRLYDKVDIKTDFNKRVLISTWQSLSRKGDKFLNQYDGIMVDECHLAKAKVQTDMVASMRNAKYRVGLTGSLNEFKIDVLTLTGSFGEACTLMTARESIEKGIATDIVLKMVYFNYDAEVTEAILNYAKANTDKNNPTSRGKSAYDASIETIKKNVVRSRLIMGRALDEPNNSLVITRHTDHAKSLRKIANELNLINKDKKVIHYIDGDISVGERDRILKELSLSDNNILIGTYGTVSTGLDVANLHNLHFAYPTKSSYNVIQSIGRMIRLCKNKKFAYIYDYCDNLPKLEDHTKDRMQIYESERHYYETEEMNI